MAWCASSGIQIRYELSGQGRSNLILIHEIGGSLESWDAVARLLEPHFRILRYDQRGAGLSEKVHAPFKIEDHARDLCAVIEAVGVEPPYRVAGLAGGAAVAVAWAQCRQEKIAAMVLCAPAIEVDAERRELLLERSERAVREGMAAIAGDILGRSYPESVIRDRAAYEGYRARFLGSDPVCYAMANRALAESNLEPVANLLNCRCLVLAGSQDSMRPPERVGALARRIPNAEFAVLDSGHLMPVQAPEAVAERMFAFLLREDSAAAMPERRDGNDE